MLARGVFRVFPTTCASLSSRLNSTSTTAVPHVAVIGSGPAGYYTAQQILKGHPAALVDVYEKLPVPFGLVRFGVAPDHPDVKNVINTFTNTANNERCTFIGNVSVGKDVSMETLRKAYTAVVLSYGAEDDKTLNIPGESLNGVMPARSFVGWYNGLPENAQLNPCLTTGDTAVVLGQGNVAIDVARMLLTPVDDLRKTDTPEFALSTLSESRIERVILVGRRGPMQVAFTIAELREMVKLPNCTPCLNREDFEPFKDIIKDLPRPRRRLTDLMVKTALSPPEHQPGNREWQLRFLRSPHSILPDTAGDRVAGIRLHHNVLQDERAVRTDETEDLPCQLIFRSIGYRSIPLSGDIPFDEDRGIIPNVAGRVTGLQGLYCSGWVKTGPVGVIVSTMNNAFETGKMVVDDLNNGKLQPSSQHGGKDMVLDELDRKGVQHVTFSDWEKIDRQEKSIGEKLGKPREKLVSVDEMMKLAKS